MMKFSRYNSLDEKPASSLSGELFKKKSAGDEWNKRWFSIEGTDLCWYDDSRSETARGAFDLKTLSRCEMDSEDLTMELRDATRDLDVRAKTEGEMLMWHRAIEMYADLAKGGKLLSIFGVSDALSSRWFAQGMGQAGCPQQLRN